MSNARTTIGHSHFHALLKNPDTLQLTVRCLLCRVLTVNYNLQKCTPIVGAPINSREGF